MGNLIIGLTRIHLPLSQQNRMGTKGPSQMYLLVTFLTDVTESRIDHCTREDNVLDWRSDLGMPRVNDAAIASGDTVTVDRSH